MKIVIFAGADGVGKTTVLNAVNKSNDYVYFCIDRFFDSAYVYDHIYNRRNREIRLFEDEYILSRLDNNTFYLIYLVCNVDEQLKRLNDKNEDKFIVDNIGLANTKYDEYFEKTHFKKLKIDTSKYDIDACVSMINEFVGGTENESNFI